MAGGGAAGKGWGKVRPENEPRYTIKEIEVATGIKNSTLRARRKALGIEVNKGYTLEEVKQIVKQPRRGQGFSRRKADALRQMLKNDGAI